MIAEAGSAKSLAILALQDAKQQQTKEAEQKLEKARRYFNEAHQYHRDLIQKEAQGDDIQLSLIFMHAEDQLMSTETILILVEEMLAMYPLIHKN
ncbi:MULTISPECIES: PTS lactose/cellobiose transporter subunit IIA [Halolactibacillus]|uniref:PTS lactose/cellobiose transporter subunit IIA n=1 Tax=Halolactibacillus TaxID=306539 RepID=UPI0021010854|nr:MULTISPECIES: PTS lactose/cellobiose transporter subunit IIA [Halolactibacillus]